MKKFILALAIIASIQFVQAQDFVKFKHILITNDDGIEDANRLLALAESVIEVADRVSIVVSAFDRSGTSNHTTFGKHQSTLEVSCKYYDTEKNIAAYIIPGNPSDCVLLGLNGLFPDNRPDLVLSGINGGPNIGPDWFGSGTIGAARMAAFLGVNSIALSGFYEKDERSFRLIPKWITQFISSGILDEMEKNSYVTIGFPKIPLDEIKGIRIVGRRVSYDKAESFSFTKIWGENPHSPENTTVWALTSSGNVIDNTNLYDDIYLQQAYIVITPMSINENNKTLLSKFQTRFHEIPNFLLP